MQEEVFQKIRAASQWGYSICGWGAEEPTAGKDLWWPPWVFVCFCVFFFCVCVCVCGGGGGGGRGGPRSYSTNRERERGLVPLPCELVRQSLVEPRPCFSRADSRALSWPHTRLALNGFWHMEVPDHGSNAGLGGHVRWSWTWLALSTRGLKHIKVTQLSL